MTGQNNPQRPVRKILVDIGHPAHVHFFKNPIKIWGKHGCEIIVTSRRKEIATELLDSLGIPHKILTSLGGGVIGLGKELITRNLKLLKLISLDKPDIMVGIGGIFIAQTGFLRRIPSIVFYDTENANLSNLITYPFTSLVVTPRCYQAWLPPWHLKYPGYHELSYLHPNHFQPDLNIAITCGLDPARKNFLIRTVSWQASHDMVDKGWNMDLLMKTVRFLDDHGNVMISAEGQLPPEFRKFEYRGLPENIHHLMGHLTMFVGESATMASECAVLGVPALYAAFTGRGYTDEQEKKYRLVYNVRDLDWSVIKATITEILDTPEHTWNSRKDKLLADTIDVAEFVADLTLNYPDSIKQFQNTFSENRAS
ncbi:MAG: DUF354 domain-containing protein [Proteobacteria bacterium]|nr:DUF354 domain-containing protein [Pseudomonadota bacterium]MBU1739230.1 DUF354 domain-containing protein [Pseudomonadota bacterium]